MDGWTCWTNDVYLLYLYPVACDRPWNCSRRNVYIIGAFVSKICRFSARDGRWSRKCPRKAPIHRTVAFPTRQAMYVQRNTEARSCNHWCCGKAISITYSESVFVALGIERAMRMRHIVVCGLGLLYSIFPHYLINGTIFGGGKKGSWT